VLWVDARTEKDFLRGHIEGAVHLPPEGWNERLGDFLERYAGEETVLVYCNPGCHSAHEVARRLQELGVERVYVLTEGYREGLFNH
jgi:rhodanese-related sulfurtransferase